MKTGYRPQSLWGGGGINEPRHEKTGFMHKGKQSCRSASLVPLFILLGYAHINIFPLKKVSGHTMGIRQQKNPNPWELDRTSKNIVGKFDTFLEVLN